MKISSLANEVLILCSVIFLNTDAFEKANIVREFIITTPDSTTVPAGEYLYTVSKNRSHVHINTTDSHFGPRTIAIDPFEDMIQGKMKVEWTANGEIFIWGVQSRQVKEVVTSTFYSLLSVDLWEKHKIILLPVSDDATPPKNFLPRLIKYNGGMTRGGFDIFFPSLKTCAPCRFSEKGNEDYPFQNLIPDGDTTEHGFHILWMNPGYFFVQNLNHSGSVLKYLKSDGILSFYTTTQKYLNYTIETIAFKKSHIRSVGICSKKQSESVPFKWYDEVRCERLNSKLHSVVSMIIPTSGQEVSSVSLEFDDEGNSFISFADNSEIHVYIYDIDGQLLQSYNLGSVDKRFEQYHISRESPSMSRYSLWDTRGFLVGAQYEAQYCVIVERVKMDEYAGPLHVVKCIDVQEYYNKSKF